MSIVPKPLKPDNDAAIVKNDIQLRNAVERGNRPVNFKKIQMYGDIAQSLQLFDHYDAHGFGPAVFTKNSEGFVYLFGMVKWIVTPTYPTAIIGFLPKGFRPWDYDGNIAPPVAGGATTDGTGGYAVPAGINNNAPPNPDTYSFACGSSSGLTEVRVQIPDGKLFVQRELVGSAYNGSWISLSGIVFYAGVGN